MSAFRRKQTGRASLAFSIVTVLMAVVTLQNQPIQALIVIIGAGVLGLLFSSLTVQVEGDTLSWWFGRRFWKQEISLTARIRSERISPVPNGEV